MDEQFLHYIWKYQLFENSLLVNNQELTVFYQGDYNLDSGPDFKEARIKVDSIEWAGQVEIHMKSSDWFHHKHNTDSAYDNVVLHVVWQHDQEVEVNGSTIPTLELKNKIDPELINRYKNHLRSKTDILCQTQLSGLNPMKISGMIDRASVERLEEKADQILKGLKDNQNDWEEIVYKTIAANFGFSTNKDAFIRLTEILPFHKLKKNLQNLLSTEALLFGQAGFLETANEVYRDELKKEYTYLHGKHQLQEPMISVQWKFGKLRPQNFPTVRLSQFASLLHNHPKLFSLLIETENVKTLKALFKVNTSDYWQSHYDFEKERKQKAVGMGEKSVEIILLNSVSPILAAFAKFTGEQRFMDRAISLLESIHFEDNRITRKFDQLFFPSKSAFDSQALIHLYKNYCSRKKCLQCNIGVNLISK